MSLSLEEALCLNIIAKQKIVNEHPEVCADEKTGKYPIVRMDLPLFNRRKEMLYLDSCGRLSPAAVKQLSEKFGVAEQALYDDLMDRERWEWVIWEQKKATLDAKDLLKHLQTAREEALWLLKTAQGGNARVGAIAQAINAIRTEVELCQSLGMLPRAKLEPVYALNLQNNIQVENSVSVNDLLKHYQQFVSGADQAGSVRKNDPAESVDKAEANG